MDHDSNRIARPRKVSLQPDTDGWGAALASELTTEPATERTEVRPYFEVTATIGRVYLDGPDGTPAHVVAFRLIGEHDAPGTYSFPREDGQITTVTVTTAPFDPNRVDR